MKIKVYEIETITPEYGSEEYFELLNQLNLPSLKFGTAEFIGKFSHYTTKTELKKIKKVSAKYYDRNYEIWRDGLLLLGNGKLFAQYAGTI